MAAVLKPAISALVASTSYDPYEMEYTFNGVVIAAIPSIQVVKSEAES